MKYSGRIVIISTAVIIIIVIRIYGHFYYNVPFYQFPFIGIVIGFIFWFLGHQYDKVKFLSENDVLTKLHNRRYMIQTFPKLIAEATRNQNKLILYFIDVDNFKDINDSEGHEVGDQVLVLIAKVLQFHSQKRDIVVRWAGDEFLIFSAFSDAYSQELIPLIKKELKSLSQNYKLPISVSIGTATFPDEAYTLDELIHTADQKMYANKTIKKK